MILYNVTVKVDNEVFSEWKKWMLEKHIPDVMATGFFKNYRFCRLLHDEPDGKTYAIQYLAENQQDFLDYAEGPSKALQKEHKLKFENKYIAIRTLMEVEKEQSI